jgi:hypothetical protein
MSFLRRIVSIDTETFYRTRGENPCTVTEHGVWAYCRHPEFYCYMISVCDGLSSWAGEPQEFDWASLDGAHLVSHNAMFDRTVIEYMMEIGQIPRFKWASWECTSELTSYLCLRRSLADAALYLYGEEVDKTARADMNGIHWRDIKDTPQGEIFLRYADSDAKYCWRFMNDFGDRWPAHTRRLAQIQRESGMRGVQIDVPKLDAYIDGISRVLFEIEQRIPWIGEGAKPTSTKAIAEMCRQVGIPCTPVKAREGEEAFAAWEALYAPLYPWVNAVSQWRVTNKFKGFLEEIRARLDSDGVMRFSLRYFGAHTGRWAGESGINLQNLRKDPLLIDRQGNLRMSDRDVKEYWDARDKDTVPDWLGLTNWGMTNDDGTPMEAVFEHAYDTRSLFIARPGFKLIMCDLAQIEPRVLAWLAGHEKMLAAIRDGFSVYEAAALATGKYSGPKGGFKKLKDLYKVQKAQTLGCGYGCGWEKYITVAMVLAGYDVCQLDPIHPETGKRIHGFTARKDVRQFREENPEIPALWEAFDKAFQKSLGETFYMELPSGRVMSYRNVSRTEKKKVRKIIDEETGELLRTEINVVPVYTAEIDGRRYEFYGGLLTENCTQATSYDVFEVELLNAIDWLLQNFPTAWMLWSVHDEGIFEVPLEVDKHDIERQMSITPDWLPGCPIGAEAQEGPCYRK